MEQAQTVYEPYFECADEGSVAVGSIDSALFLLPAEIPVNSWRYRYVKRAFDVLWASLLIAVFAIPGLLIAAAILLTSRGPIFYRERRIGRNGIPFIIWKFRSMHQNAAQRSHIASSQSDPVAKQWRMCKHLPDPRITAIGGFLRRASLDELPQLFNVLRGEMSLIGPRPIVEAEAEFYAELLPMYLAATPGLSGLWQVSGRSNIGYMQRAQLDAAYVQGWSLRTDLRIFYQTIPVLINRVGAS